MLLYFITDTLILEQNGAKKVHWVHGSVGWLKGSNANQKVAGSGPNWVFCPNLVCKSVYGFAHLKEHVGLFERSTGLSPVPSFYLS